MVVRKILETTLAAGATTVTFTDSDIPNSLIRVYSNDPDLMPQTQTLSGTTLTITYEAQSSAKGIAVEIVKQGLDIVDNVTSTDIDKALSANQGKVLKDAIDSIVIPTVPENITDLNDVSVTDIENGQVLAWNITSEKFENVGQSGGGSQNYSTSEVVIGKWIDNSDVYKCVVTGLNISMPALNTWSSVFCDSLNIKDIIDCQLFDASNPINVILLNIEQMQVLDGGIRIERATSVLSGRTITRAILTYIKNS